MNRSLNCVLITIALLFCALTSIGAQENRDVAFEVPGQYISLILIDDPACPLKLMGPVRTVAHSNGALSFGYTIANRSKSNIQEFLVSEIDWFGNQEYSHPSTVNKEWDFSPGRYYSTFESEKLPGLKPWDESLARRAAILSQPNRFWIAFIVKVKLSDGTTYDASEKLRELHDFVNQPFSKSGMSANDLQEREDHLRQLAVQLFSTSSGAAGGEERNRCQVCDSAIFVK